MSRCDVRYRLTGEQRAALAHAFVSKGKNAAVRLACEYGVSPDYPAKLALKLGLRPRHQPIKRTPIPRHKHHVDPRWAWAIERGPVIV